MPSTSAPPGDRPLRRDARENRERILEAARAAFAELGVEASVEEISRRAHVGVGTLYRRFPTKDSLIDAVFDEHLHDMAAAARLALEEPDAWDGFLEYLTWVVGRQASDRGLSEMVGASLRTEQLVARARKQLRPVVQRLIARAQESGALRADVVYEDISVLLWTTGRVVDATREIDPDFWKRYLALVVDGLSADGASLLPRPPLTPAKHREAMRQFLQPRSEPGPARNAPEPS